MKIAGLQRVSLIDYPGHIAATVFLAGCNLNCGYCQNRWMIDATQVTPAMSVAALSEWLETRVGLLDGVCLSGGEPTLSADLAELVRGIRALGFMVKLDTNGTRPEALRALLVGGLVDYVAMDLKAPLDEQYSALTGCAIDLDAIRASMAALRAWDPTGVRYEFRTTVAPGLDAAALADMAADVRPHERWYLQPYEPTDQAAPELAGAGYLRRDELVRVAEELAAKGARVSVRGEGAG